MPELDGFELATMIRQHPRFAKTAIILVSGILVEDRDRLKGYDSGAVDYVSVPIIPEILRAKVAVFAELFRKNQELEERRRLMETVLETVGTGVVVVDHEGATTAINAAGCRLLGLEPGVVGRRLEELLMGPGREEILGLVLRLLSGRVTRQDREVQLGVRGRERHLAVTVVPLPGHLGSPPGAVVVLDDLTPLMRAQKVAAWGEVARKLAHEIKNPLTPIQLATERLKRRYRKQIEQDADLFEELTGTIIRQVGDVTRMVDEFSAFARMPKPQMEDYDIRDVVRASVLDRQMANSDIAFDKKFPNEPIIVSCDRRLISQAIHNLVKNAEEAIQGYAESPDKDAGWRGRIETIVRGNGSTVDIEVIDNGPGLPKHNRARLLEPLAQPEIDITKLEDNETLEFTAEVDVKPEIVQRVARAHEIVRELESLEAKAERIAAEVADRTAKISAELAELKKAAFHA